MKLFATLYIDEDVSVLVATLLQARGVDVLTARDQKMLGQQDQEQLAFAVAQRRCLLTHNRDHFLALHLQYIAEKKRHSGIIIAVKRNPYELAERIGMLINRMTADEIEDQIFFM